MENLKSSWSKFLNIVLDPWTILLLASIILLVFLSQNENYTQISSLIYLLASISSAILGSRVTKNWLDLSEGRVLVARGKSAIRALRLLSININILEKRVKEYIKRQGKIDIKNEIVVTYLEEILDKCNILQEETINSIENWTDIIPEIDIKSKIGLISDYKNKVEQTQKEIQELNDKYSVLEKTKGESDIEKKRLKKEIDEKRLEVMELSFALDEAKNKLNESVHTSISGSTVSNAAPDPFRF